MLLVSSFRVTTKHDKLFTTTVLIFIPLFLLQFFHIIKATSVKSIQQVSILTNAMLNLHVIPFLLVSAIEIVEIKIRSGSKFVYGRMVLLYFFVLKIDVGNVFRNAQCKTTIL